MVRVVPKRFAPEGKFNKFEPSPLRPAILEREVALAETVAFLQQTGEKVRRLLPQARNAEVSFNSAAQLSSPGVGFALGLAGGAAASVARAAVEAEASSASDRLNDGLWTLDADLQQLVRRVMVLEEHGLGVAQHALPLANRFGSFAGGYPAGLADLLYELHEYLRWFHGGMTELLQRERGEA